MLNTFCHCQAEAFAHPPAPLFRLICHCKTCQAFLGLPYNDECTFLRRDLPALQLEQIAFKSYQSPLLPIKRGTCRRCGKVAVCLAQVGRLTPFVMVPSVLLGAALPEPVAHIYYDRRVADAEDALPKLSGHLTGQALIQAALAKSLILGRAKL
ncbi:MAG: GFA family protein [Candidatus Sericytochromatia bacterium]